MKRILATLLALAATSAFAVGIGNDNPPSGGGTQTVVQGQLQGQIQGQAQLTNVEVSNRIANDTRAAAQSYAAGGVGQAVSGGSQSGVNFEITSPKNTPSVFSGNVYPTAPCMGSTTVGGAGVGFGFSVGSSWTDDECGIRETARSFRGMGLDVDALKVLCTSKYAAAAPSCAVKE
jgi:hypothetical protein